ncbi:serine/threonine protein phosphatase 1 [Nitrobacteraceae bacterium AZCC 2161]
MITFAIGDIHGCRDKLDDVLGTCMRFMDTMVEDETPPKFVFLGDVIDRGPDSRGVIDRILWLRENGGVEVVTLMGNHEWMFLNSRGPGNSEIAKFWAKHGGINTMDSYGVRGSELAKEKIEGHVRSYYSRLVPFQDDGHRFFVHAGVDLAKPLATQTEEVMLWGAGVRNANVDPGRYVVHGHIKLLIPQPVPQRHHINLDTAAYLGGPLSCAVFDSEVPGGPVALICDDRIIELEREVA